MTRPVDVDLTAEHEQWRDIPMPGANLPLTMVRLESADDELTLYARFPAGFERPVAGGYVVSEEFLVLDGTLVLDGFAHQRGDLVFVPAHQLRTGMHSPQECTVLAWFGGLAHFVEAAELSNSTAGGTRTVSVLDVEPGAVLETGVSRWVAHRGEGADPRADDLVDLDLGRWRRGGAAVEPADVPLLVRTRG